MTTKQPSASWRSVAGTDDGWIRALGRGWNLVARLGRTVDDRPCLTALAVERDAQAGAPDAGGIGSLQWRSVNVGEVLSQIVAVVAERDGWRSLVGQEEDALDDFKDDDWALRGRAGHDPLAYARLALAYEVMIRGGVRTPKQNLAEVMRCSVATVSTRLAKARELNLLSPAQPGQPGGQLTPEGHALIDTAYPVQSKPAKH